MFAPLLWKISIFHVHRPRNVQNRLVQENMEKSRCQIVLLHVLTPLISSIQVDEDVAKIGNPVDEDMPEDEMLTARLDLADYKFSFHEKSREYNPAWMSPEGMSYAF